MAELRLKGQEVEVRIAVNDVVQTTFTAVASFEETMLFEKKDDGFLGETTNRKDEIFNGFDGKMEMQVATNDWVTFQNAVKSRAQRKTPNTVINLIRTDFYANGQTSVMTYPDAKFGPMPTTVGGRGEYVKVAIDFSSSDRDENLTAVA